MPKYADEKSYGDSKQKWAQKHQLKPNANLESVKFLYHSTHKVNFEGIKTHGLQPKKKEWGDPDASKDGFLSMATTPSGAGSMGGKSILLRMKTDGDLSNWDFRRYSDTEVRTTVAIAPTNLEWKDGGKWKPVV